MRLIGKTGLSDLLTFNVLSGATRLGRRSKNAHMLLVAVSTIKFRNRCIFVTVSLLSFWRLGWIVATYIDICIIWSDDDPVNWTRGQTAVWWYLLHQKALYLLILCTLPRAYFHGFRILWGNPISSGSTKFNLTRPKHYNETKLIFMFRTI